MIKVDPVSSINLAADTYRNVTGLLGSTDFIFSAVVNHNGNIAMRDTDRLVVGPSNLYNINTVGQTEYYLDVPQSDMDTFEAESLKQLVTDLKLSPSLFTYVFVNLYADIVDENYNSLNAVEGFTVSTDKPYSVTLKEKGSDKTRMRSR